MDSGDRPSDPLPASPARPQADRRRRPALVDSLRHRYSSAKQRQDAAAKRALFKEAVYLGIQPEEFTA
jgi:hypothetical protein